MHLALATELFCCASEMGGGGLPAPGRRPAHACWADWNAGASGLMSDGRLTLPFAFRSGKFGTPWERMQSEYLTACGEALEASVLVDLLEDPQAAIPTPQPTAASVISSRWRSPRRGVHVRCRCALEPFGLATASVLADHR